MTDNDRDAIRHFLGKGVTPLEISQALNIPFHVVRSFCEKEALEPRKFFVATGVRKAVQEDAYWGARA